MNDDTSHPGHDEHDLLEIEELLRSLSIDDLGAPEPPPPSIWNGIEQQLTATGDLSPAPEAPALAPVTSLGDHRARSGRRSFGGRQLLLAAAAAVLVVAGAVAVVATRGGDQPPVVASADLAWDAQAFDELGRDAAATAELVETDDGYEIVLTDADLPTGLAEDEDLELWLIAQLDDGSLDVQPVSLVDAGDPGRYEVPATLDPATYSIVDISIEPRDGDEAHSGRSILRGELSA